MTVFKLVTGGFRLHICDDDLGHVFAVHEDGDGPAPICGAAVGESRGDPTPHQGYTCGRCLYLRAAAIGKDPDAYMDDLSDFARREGTGQAKP